MLINFFQQQTRYLCLVVGAIYVVCGAILAYIISQIGEMRCKNLTKDVFVDEQVKACVSESYNIRNGTQLMQIKGFNINFEIEKSDQRFYHSFDYYNYVLVAATVVMVCVTFYYYYDILLILGILYSVHKIRANFFLNQTLVLSRFIGSHLNGPSGHFLLYCHKTFEMASISSWNMQRAYCDYEWPESTNRVLSTGRSSFDFSDKFVFLFNYEQTVKWQFFKARFRFLD